MSSSRFSMFLLAYKRTWGRSFRNFVLAMAFGLSLSQFNKVFCLDGMNMVLPHQSNVRCYLRSCTCTHYLPCHRTHCIFVHPSGRPITSRGCHTKASPLQYLWLRIRPCVFLHNAEQLYLANPGR